MVAVRGLQAHKATGPDEVPARLLKEAADQLVSMLIFRVVYQLHNSSCRMANSRILNVVLIYKKYIKLYISCILNTSVFDLNLFQRYGTYHQFLHNAQHGFRKKRSFETQLLRSANDFFKSLNSSTQTNAISLDFDGLRSMGIHQVPQEDIPYVLQSCRSEKFNGS